MKSNASKASKFKIKAFGLVIGPDGIPVVDNPKECPEELWSAMTKEEQKIVNERAPLHLKRVEN